MEILQTNIWREKGINKNPRGSEALQTIASIHFIASHEILGKSHVLWIILILKSECHR